MSLVWHWNVKNLMLFLSEVWASWKFWTVFHCRNKTRCHIICRLSSSVISLLQTEESRCRSGTFGSTSAEKTIKPFEKKTATSCLVSWVSCIYLSSLSPNQLPLQLSVFVNSHQHCVWCSLISYWSGIDGACQEDISKPSWRITVISLNIDCLAPPAAAGDIIIIMIYWRG